MTASSRKVRRSAADWRRIVSHQAASALSQQAYCEQHGIAISTFCAWRARLRDELETGPMAGGRAPECDDFFAELSMEESMQSSAPQHWDVELALGGGRVLRIRTGSC